jgi:hypothetical protein
MKESEIILGGALNKRSANRRTTESAIANDFHATSRRRSAAYRILNVAFLSPRSFCYRSARDIIARINGGRLVTALDDFYAPIN